MSLGDYVQKLEGDYGIAPAGLDLDAPFNNIRLRSDKDSLDRLKELDRIRSIVQPELGWDDARWEREAGDYARTWTSHYAPPHARHKARGRQ